MKIGVVIVIALVILGAVAVGYVATTNFSGRENLEITILGQDGDPIPYLEVDVWKESKASGNPFANAETNLQGIAEFRIAAGNYLIGFNDLNFPEILTKPDKIPMIVVKDKETDKKTIILYAKS